MDYDHVAALAENLLRNDPGMTHEKIAELLNLHQRDALGGDVTAEDVTKALSEA